MDKYGKPLKYVAFGLAGVFALAAFYAYPYVYLPVAAGFGYAGYRLNKSY